MILSSLCARVALNMNNQYLKSSQVHPHWPLMLIRWHQAWLSSIWRVFWSGHSSELHLSHHITSLYLPIFPDGARVASSTGIDILLLDDFKLVINDTTHLVRPPRRGTVVLFTLEMLLNKMDKWATQALHLSKSQPSLFVCCACRPAAPWGIR